MPKMKMYDCLITQPLTPKRLAGALVLSLVMLRSAMAREAEIRALARSITGERGPGADGLIVLVSPRRTRRTVILKLQTWSRPTLAGTIRPVALAMAELRIRPTRELTAHA